MLTISQLADILFLVAFFIPAFINTEKLYSIRRREDEFEIDDYIKFVNSLANLIILSVLFRVTNERISILPGFILSLIASLAIVGACFAILLQLALYLENRQDITWRHLAIFGVAIVLITLLVVL